MRPHVDLHHPHNSNPQHDPHTGRLAGKDPSQLSLSEIVHHAARSGAAGALAMGANVVTLMWVRTVLDYQYKHGVSFRTALGDLWAQGGVARFYRGLPFALIQGPLCRFGDAAANTAALSYLNCHPQTADWNMAYKTAVGTSMASLFRVALMPVDTCKVTMQVTGKLEPLLHKVQTHGVFTLYHGSLAALSATFVGQFPWFFTYNFLSERIPPAETALGELGRRGFIGFSSSVTSDVFSNIFRIIKVQKQASVEDLSYTAIVRRVLQESGVWGLLFRGLETRILANGLQGLLFSVLWKYLERHMFHFNDAAQYQRHTMAPAAEQAPKVAAMESRRASATTTTTTPATTTAAESSKEASSSTTTTSATTTTTTT